MLLNERHKYLIVPLDNIERMVLVNLLSAIWSILVLIILIILLLLILIISWILRFIRVLSILDVLVSILNVNSNTLSIIEPQLFAVHNLVIVISLVTCLIYLKLFFIYCSLLSIALLWCWKLLLLVLLTGILRWGH